MMPGHTQATDTPVIDYEGSQYKANFWEGQGRDYEDAVERLVLKQLLPTHGSRLAEIGAGFGRLANMYIGYDQIILFDYSRTLLQDAVKQWGHDPRFVFVAGNIYQLPLASGVLDSLVMVRVMHHLADVPLALQQIQRVLHQQSVAVVEYANKRNLKALLRWGMGRQDWSPMDQLPIEFVKLNFDFHPSWMEKRFAEADLRVRAQRAVSHSVTAFKKLCGHRQIGQGR
jgi:SAM-dependent methyltransferase